MNANLAPRGNILVIDDTADNLRLLGTMLGQAGYEVRPVTAGRQGLQAAEHLAPDLVLLDISMPEMDGYEFCRCFKEREHLRDIPVIFLTALTDTGAKMEAFRVGGEDFITKPFQMNEVLARVEVHLSLRLARKTLAENLVRLRELETLRHNLVHMIVHDMRSPLTVIGGHLQILARALGDSLGADSAASLREAQGGVHRLTGMANDVLDVSKMEEGKLQPQPAPCDLFVIARTAAEELGCLDTSRRISVTQSGSPLAKADAALVRRMVENLLGNALRHSPTGGVVRVTVVAHVDRVRLSVIDSGEGVPEESRHKIFDKYGALAARAGMKYHSVGLGLAFSKLAVEAQGGTIGVEAAEGGGANFWFELPRG